MNSNRSAARSRAALRCLVTLACFAGALQVHAADTVFPDAKPAFRVLSGGAMSDAATLSDGSTIVAGTFDAVNGVMVKNLARRLPDGSVDPNFNPVPNYGVGSVAVDADDAIYVVGSFDTIGGLPRTKIAKLSASGVVDPAFNAAPLQYPQQVVAGGGSIYVAGFNSVNGSPAYRVVKLSSAGAVDPNFGVSVTLAIPGGPDIRRIAYDASTDSLFVSGFFSAVNGVSAPFAAKVRSDGTVDANFAPNTNLEFNAIEPDGAGNLYVGGGFTAIGGSSQRRLAKISATTGAVDTNWNPSLPGSQSVSAIALTGGDVFATGFLTEVDGTPVQNLVRLSSTTGEVDPNFYGGPSGLGSFQIEAIGSRIIIGSGQLVRARGEERLGAAVFEGNGDLAAPFDLLAPGQVRSIVSLPNGDTVIAGEFVYVGSERRTRIAKIDAAGDVVAGFAPNIDGTVLSIAADPAGTFLYAAGTFDFSGNAQASSLTRFALSTGEHDPTWVPQPFGLDGVPGAKVVSVSSGGIFVGGTFPEMFMQGRGYLAKLDPVDGTAIAAFDTNVSGPVTQVLATSDGSAVFIAGNFTTVGGANRRSLAKVSASTGAVDAWSADLNVGASVFGFAQAGSDLYVVGNFDTIGGIARPRMAKVDATTSAVDGSFNPAFNGFGVNAVAVDADDGVFVAGNFSTIDGNARFRLAKLTASTGELDATWIADTYWSDLGALAIDAAGDLVLGGRATSDVSGQYVSLQSRFGIAKLPAAVPPPVVLPDPVFANGFE